MGRSCAALGCTKNYSKNCSTSFHRFPADESKCQSWILAARRRKWKPTQYSFLCSKHFTKDCFLRSRNNRMLLKKDAVPSIFNFPKHASQGCKKWLIVKEPEITKNNSGTEEISDIEEEISDDQEEIYEEEISDVKEEIYDEEIYDAEEISDVKEEISDEVSDYDEDGISYAKEEMCDDEDGISYANEEMYDDGISYAKEEMYDDEEEMYDDEEEMTDDAEEIFDLDGEISRNVKDSGTQTKSSENLESSDSALLAEAQNPEILRTMLNSFLAIAKDRDRRIKTLHQKYGRLSKQNKNLASAVNTIEEKLRTHNFEIVEKSAPVVKEYLQSINNSNSGIVSPEVKAFSVSLYCYSSKAYDFVRETFDNFLPHPTTLYQYNQEIEHQPNFTEVTSDEEDNTQEPACTIIRTSAVHSINPSSEADTDYYY